MVDTKSLEATRRNWEGAIGRVPGAYKSGVQAAQNIIQKSIGGQGLYEERMKDPSVLARRARGLSKISDEDWRKKAATLGAARIGAGMDAAKDKFGTGISEVLSVLQSITLPARVADPATNVANRVTPIAVGLHVLKER